MNVMMTDDKPEQKAMTDARSAELPFQRSKRLESMRQSTMTKFKLKTNEVNSAIPC